METKDIIKWKRNMKNMTKKDQMVLLDQVIKEARSILDFVDDDKLKRMPTIIELERWNVEIVRGILFAKSEAHRDKVWDLSLLFMSIVKRCLKSNPR